MASNVDLLIRGGTVVSDRPGDRHPERRRRAGPRRADRRGRPGAGRWSPRRRGRRRLAHDRDARPRRDALAHVELARAQLRDRRLRVLPGQVGDIGALRARRLLPERGARARRGAERRDHHGPQLVAQHAHAGARRRGAVRPSRHPGPCALRVRPHRLPRRQHAARLHRHRPGSARVVRGRRRLRRARPSRASTCADRTSAAWTSFDAEMAEVTARRLPGRDPHRAGRVRPRSTRRSSSARATSGPISSSPTSSPRPARDRAALARTGTPLSYAVHSELRLGDAGDRARGAAVVPRRPAWTCPSRSTRRRSPRSTSSRR